MGVFRAGRPIVATGVGLSTAQMGGRLIGHGRMGDNQAMTDPRLSCQTTDAKTLDQQSRKTIGWADTPERRAARVAAIQACLTHPTEAGQAQWRSCPMWREFRSVATGAPMVTVAAGLACDPGVALPFLVESGADPHALDERGRGALFAAAQGCRKFRVAWVQRLLEFGVDPLIQDHDGLTCITAALHSGDVRVLEAMVAGGARPSDADRREMSKINSRDVIVRFWELFGGPDTPETCTQAVVAATSRQHWNQVALLVERGADPNATVDGTPLLVLACQRSRPRMELIECLVAHGASPEACDLQGRNALAAMGQQNRFNPSRQRLKLTGVERAIARGRQAWLDSRIQKAETPVAPGEGARRPARL